MSNNVISGPGHHSLPVETEPNELVIKFLERLLQEARNGDVQGIGCVFVDKNWDGAYSLVGSVGGYSMIGGAQCIVGELVEINMKGAER